MLATIKSAEDISKAALNRDPNGGYHMRGQYFPDENLVHCGRQIEVSPWKSGFVYESYFDGEWHFFSKDALIIIQ